jgi:hypothetical protein
VVVLPLPVGPVTSRIPCTSSSALRKRSIAGPSNPSDSKLSGTPPLSRIRITTLSPCIVGMVETRRSISLPETLSLMRPSCGRRRSAMSSEAMIFTREITAAERRRGGDSTSCSTPSIR